MKRNIAATAASPKGRSGNMKASRQPKTAAPEPQKSRSLAEPFVGSLSSDGFQWPPVEVPRRLRACCIDTTLPRCRSLKPHAVLGVLVSTGRRSSTGLRPRRPVPFPLSRVPSSHLSGVLQALATTASPAVGVPKIHSSDCSAFAAVDSTPSVIQSSDVSGVAIAEANSITPLLQKNVKSKLHPVLGVFVRTRSRGSGRPGPCNRVPKLLSLFPGGNCEN